MTSDLRLSPSEIESEIGRTRAQLGRTLEALAQKLAARELLGKEIDMITRSIGANKPGAAGLGEAVRANAIPLGLIGIGVGWLVANNTGRFGGGSGPPPQSASAPVEDPAERIVGRTGEPRIDDPDAGRGDGWVHRTADAARGGLRSIRDHVDAVGDAAIERAGEPVGDVGHLGDRARRAGDRLIETFERNPLLVGLVGAVSGAVIAALLPPGGREQEFIRGAREDLWKKAEALGHEAADRVRGVAGCSTGAPADPAIGN